ncbi:MAG: MucR family transcriptional regulator, partial [Pseudomonadota bacterium]
MSQMTDDALGMEEPDTYHLLALTSEIVSAHVSNNSVEPHELPGVIESVFKTLASFGEHVEPEPVRPEPAVPIKKSITPDFIVCLEDGK